MRLEKLAPRALWHSAHRSTNKYVSSTWICKDKLRCIYIYVYYARITYVHCIYIYPLTPPQKTPMFRLVQQVLQHLSRSLVCQSSVPKDKTSVETYMSEEHMHLGDSFQKFLLKAFFNLRSWHLRTSHQRNSGNLMEQSGAPEHVLEYRVLSSLD